MGKKIIYSEPASYFSKEAKKAGKLGEYADTDKKKTPAKKKVKRK